MKTVDEILLETHVDRDFNYNDIRRAFSILEKEVRSDMYPLIFRGQQWLIWQALTTLPQPTKDISRITGIPSKNISTQIKNMINATGLVKFSQQGKLKYWSKMREPGTPQTKGSENSYTKNKLRK